MRKGYTQFFVALANISDSGKTTPEISSHNCRTRSRGMAHCSTPRLTVNYDKSSNAILWLLRSPPTKFNDKEGESLNCYISAGCC